MRCCSFERLGREGGALKFLHTTAEPWRERMSALGACAFYSALARRLWRRAPQPGGSAPR